MEDDPEQDALFKIEGPDEDRCVCSEGRGKPKRPSANGCRPASKDIEVARLALAAAVFVALGWHSYN